ncbi:MAG TPA: efflux RND transporter periplasmic adaptor subunit [Candidatus Binataceae bacterium]|nr:efflux RND transporter periplasmic adaptor subunit [Candidatus Binataceae bacterium]
MKGIIHLKLRWIARAAIGALALAILAGCSRGSSQAGFGEREAVPVLVAKAEQKTVATRIHAIGRVEAYSTVEIKAQISGEITEVNFKEGEDVKKGDLLFTIDPRPFEAALLQAKASLAKDEAEEVQAAADEQRYAQLLKQSVGSQQQYDLAHANAEADRATVAADKAAVQTAELNLAYTTIHAPIDGRTGNLLVHAGNLVKANADTGMIMINQVKPVYVDFSIPEQRLPDVRRYMADRELMVDTTIPGQQGLIESGNLTFVDNAVDTKTGTIELKGIFTNQDNKLWPGQFVEATLILDQRPNTVVVPSQAIQTGVDGSYVFVVDKQMKVQSRPVVLGENYDGQTIVESGLKSGETVVTDGQLRLVPGASVTIKSGLDQSPGVTS